MKKGVFVLIVSGALGFLSACGNAKSNFTQDPPTEVEDNRTTNNGNGTTKLETFTGADPDAGKPKAEEEAIDMSDVKSVATEIEWLDFETAIDRNKEDKKFIFIDVYTDWCTWCKKMDQSTFKHPDVVRFIDENFYAVKMDAETTEGIAYKEVLYEQKRYGQKNYNELAVNLLSGKISFPSFVVLNKREVKRGVIIGYQTDRQLLQVLQNYLN